MPTNKFTLTIEIPPTKDGCCNRDCPLLHTHIYEDPWCGANCEIEEDFSHGIPIKLKPGPGCPREQKENKK